MSSIYAEDDNLVAGLQKLRFFPQATVGGRGSWLRDENGRERLDLSGAWGAASLGYGHPALVAAVTEAVSDPAGASVLSSASRPANDLARLLIELFPSEAPQKVWFGHSGSDATETAVRAARQATGKQGIIAFEGAYHGCTTGSMAISGHGVLTGEKAGGLILLPYPRSAEEAELVLAQLAARLEQEDASDIAAAIFEPILSDGGLIVPPEGFFARFDAVLRARGILTIADEVKVGLARSGRMHAFEYEGFRPDILVLGKGLGGGLPLAAVIGPAWVMDCALSFAMQTLHGNPVSVSAGLAVLRTIAAEGLAEQAAQVGAHLRAGLEDLAARQQGWLRIALRGRGLVIGIEIRDGAGQAAASETAALVCHLHCLGLIAYYVGEQSNVIELTPPLILTIAEADQAIALFARAFDDLAMGRIDLQAARAFAGW